jgi:hypothetical protein
MNKSRRAILIAVAAMTPALGVARPAKAHSLVTNTTEFIEYNTTTKAMDREALKRGLFAISPFEQMRIAGDRVRWAKSTGHQGKAPVKRRINTGPHVGPHGKQ